MKHVYVEFEKMLSDGNYGRERAVIQFSQDIEDDQDEQHVATLLLSQARNRLRAYAEKQQRRRLQEQRASVSRQTVEEEVAF